METYTIIDDLFDDEDGQRNQLTAARGFVGQSHVPEDMRPPGRGRTGKVSQRPDLPDFDPRANRGNPQLSPQMRLQSQNDNNMSPMVRALVSSNEHTTYPGLDSLPCRDVFTHVENCPLCKSYFRHDAKFYWMIIAILIVIILLITRNGK